MAVEVAKVELKSVQDASGLEERILAGQFTADQVVAVVGETEGNGGGKDFTPPLPRHPLPPGLFKPRTRSATQGATGPMGWGGGCASASPPHPGRCPRDANQQ